MSAVETTPAHSPFIASRSRSSSSPAAPRGAASAASAPLAPRTIPAPLSMRRRLTFKLTCSRTSFRIFGVWSPLNCACFVLLSSSLLLFCLLSLSRKLAKALPSTNRSAATSSDRTIWHSLANLWLKRDVRRKRLSIVQEGSDLSQRVASQGLEPDLLCLKAKLLSELATPDCAEAEACLHAALCMTHETGAKSGELRVALGLCGLQRRRGGREERETLAAVAAWFPEGFDTKDLREARELLAHLNRPHSTAPHPRDTLTRKQTGS